MLFFFPTFVGAPGLTTNGATTRRTGLLASLLLFPQTQTVQSNTPRCGELSLDFRGTKTSKANVWLSELVFWAASLATAETRLRLLPATEPLLEVVDESVGVELGVEDLLNSFDGTTHSSLVVNIGIPVFWDASGPGARDAVFLGVCPSIVQTLHA